MANGPKFPLLDPLGLPVSPEAIWDSVESAISDGLKTVGEATQETVGIITGKGLDMNEKLDNFNQPTTKSPELVEKEQTKSRLKNARIFFSSLEEARANAQRFAHEPSLSDSDIQSDIEAMPEETWNVKLHLSRDFDKRHTQNKPYYKAEYRRILKAEQGAARQAEETRVATEVQPRSSSTVGRGELETRIWGADHKRTFEDHNMGGPG
ncbi:MAG: hypothetical protein G01um10147_1128 [Microgenomates group bacterium Gr01-1014_7]|nr:MAG: hypothetical protein G01um10147_1128 [Microgenomates group bacterium Gr01-1014_7]